jgi:hypothetical protein
MYGTAACSSYLPPGKVSHDYFPAWAMRGFQVSAAPRVGVVGFSLIPIVTGPTLRWCVLGGGLFRTRGPVSTNSVIVSTLFDRRKLYRYGKGDPPAVVNNSCAIS